jgi:hypothetical protein
MVLDLALLTGLFVAGVNAVVPSEQLTQQTNTAEIVQKYAQADQNPYAFLTDPKVQAMLQQKPIANIADDQGIITAYKTQRQKRIDFYNEYLVKYYPKARVISHKFLAVMNAEQIEKALGDVIGMLTQETWHYIANNPNHVNLIYYWEFLTDQLSLLHDFLVRARYNIKTNTVVLPSKNMYFNTILKYDENPFLIDYLLDQGCVHAAQFFALTFDFIVKLFNESIMLSDYKGARYYLSELEYLEGNMRGTIYEIDYQENVKTAREVFAKFKERTESKLHIDEDFRTFGTKGSYV